MTKIYDGGYYALNQDMIRGGLHKHTAVDPNAASDIQMDAINYVGTTQWEVNSDVLELIKQAYAYGSDIDGIPSPHDHPIPPKLTEEDWNNLSDVERRDYKYNLSKIHERNANLASKRESLTRKLAIADECQNRPIWFPHFYDFRFRMYPLPQDLNPQGDHLTKALLRFHKSHKLGKDGYKWFAIGLANTFGKDKMPFTTRELFAHVNHDQIIDSALNPWDGERLWMQADEPFMFWAHCVEWYEMHQLSDPTQYESRIPGAMDGVTNGLQHLSLMGFDPVGATKTNCSDEDERYDLYDEVADAARQIVNIDAANGVEQAHAWVGKIKRTTVKRAVMTTPYGVTQRGIQDQLIADGHLDGLEGDRVANAKYMKDVIMESLRSVVSAATEVMAYFQDIAFVLAEYNVPLKWKTPAGATITQSYWNLKRSRVPTLMGTFVLWHEDEELGLKPSKCSLSASPNIVHSNDGAMLQMTVVRLAEKYGVDSFAMIHDSYGVHYGYVEEMQKELRQVAYDMYKDDWLGQFHEYVKSYTPEGVDLPTPPKPGTFSIERVLASPYFFS